MSSGSLLSLSANTTDMSGSGGAGGSASASWCGASGGAAGAAGAGVNSSRTASTSPEESAHGLSSQVGASTPSHFGDMPSPIRGEGMAGRGISFGRGAEEPGLGAGCNGTGDSTATGSSQCGAESAARASGEANKVDGLPRASVGGPEGSACDADSSLLERIDGDRQKAREQESQGEAPGLLDMVRGWFGLEHAGSVAGDGDGQAGGVAGDNDRDDRGADLSQQEEE